MLYTVNARILYMIQNSNWMPSNVTALENLLNTKIVGSGVNIPMKTISSWFSEIKEKTQDRYSVLDKDVIRAANGSIKTLLKALSLWFSEIKDRTKNKNVILDIEYGEEIIIPENKDVLALFVCLSQYYKALAEYSNEIIDTYETKKCTTNKPQFANNELNEIIVELQRYEDMYFNDDFSISTDDMFKALAKYYHPICTNVWEIHLKRDMAYEQLQTLYKNFLNCSISICDLISSIEEVMFVLYKSSWQKNVLTRKNLNRYYSTNKSFSINKPQNVIISFCNNVTKYANSSQDIISASLFNTKDLVSNNDKSKAFQDREFGFLYDFSPDTILGMEPSDLYSYNTNLNSYSRILDALFREVPLCGHFQISRRHAPIFTEAKAVHMSTMWLKPIYDFNEFQEKTVIYNEIVLCEEAKPYGIFVFRDKLCEVIPEIFSLTIVMGLPLFICNSNGSLDYVPCDKIPGIINDRFGPIAI